MSWSGLSSNQTVSFANLKNGVDTAVFVGKQTQSTSNEQVTKTDAQNYVYLNTGTTAWTGLTSTQLPVKSDFTAASTYTVTPYASWGELASNYDYYFYYYIDSGPENYIGLVTSALCVSFSPIAVPQGSTIYFDLRSSTLAGDAVYYDASESTTCPANDDVYCGCFPGMFNITPFGNTSVAATVYINSLTDDPIFCC